MNFKLDYFIDFAYFIDIDLGLELFHKIYSQQYQEYQIVRQFYRKISFLKVN